MKEYANCHVQLWYIDGLNMGKEKFVWNDKLMFTSVGAEGGNVAEVRILIDKPVLEIDKKSSLESGIELEGTLLLTIFLACFRLVNKNLDLVLNQKETYSYSVTDVEDFKSNLQITMLHRVDSDLPQHPIEDCKKYLTNTIPLFEKVIKNIDFKQNKSKNPLAISLPLFYRVTNEDELKSIIDFVVVLESLVCENEKELKYKLASRTASLIQTSSKDTKSEFEFLKEIYRLRSELIHGSYISLDMFSEEFTGTQMYLEQIVRRALLEYIELVDSGLSKKQIVEQLDLCNFQ